nr:SCO2525 family SAM-dependent methyltransferase [uncultured Actinoplanes sp.]
MPVPDTSTSVAPSGLSVEVWPGNADVEWDKFDSDKYFESNYGKLLREDAEIIGIVADHFHRFAGQRWRNRAIDVGSGTNLYPGMTMLPFAGEVVLFERAFTNRQWLEKQLKEPAASWDQFWDEIRRGRPQYDRIKKPLEQLRSRAEVTRGNVFALTPKTYDMGTMFFVSESITTRMDEFERATHLFIASLTSRAPFAAAFMKDSAGYWVAGRKFPACSINEKDVQRCLENVALIDDIRVVESHDLREGYGGMIVATGRKK